MTRILYIGGGREAQETLEKARALGLEIVYVQKQEKFKDLLRLLVDEVELVDYEDTAALVALAKAVHAKKPLTAAISLSEDALIAAAEVREALGLAGNSLATVKLLKDKALMRAHLAAKGVSPVQAKLGATDADVRAFAAVAGYPLIVKPVDGAGSLGIFKISADSDIPPAVKAFRELKIARFIMEEYLDGPEISVESFSFHGNHVVLAVTDKLTLANHVEIGHQIPANLAPSLQTEVIAVVKAFLDAIDFKEGPSHTELKLTKKGPRIIESHDRPGGDRLNELVRVVTGFDMKTMAFAWSCGLVPALAASPELCGGVAIRFFTPAPGAVSEISGVDDVAADPDVVELQVATKVGAVVRPVTESYDRSGHLVVRGRTVAEAARRCGELAARIRIVTG